MNSNLSLIKVITNISKTLNIANQMIPLYKQVKPLIIKSNEVLSNVNKFKNNINQRIQQPAISNNNRAQIPQIPKNLPTFFQ